MYLQEIRTLAYQNSIIKFLFKARKKMPDVPCQ